MNDDYDDGRQERRANKALTERNQRIYEQWKAGTPIKQIAKEFNLTESGIHYVVQKARVALRMKRERENQLKGA
jgi:DNA-binding NarL/FixJ family response regulator